MGKLPGAEGTEKPDAGWNKAAWQHEQNLEHNGPCGGGEGLQVERGETTVLN